MTDKAPEKLPDGDRAKSGTRAKLWSRQIGDLLKQAEAHGVRCAPGSSARLEAYCGAVSSWAKRAGLVSKGDLPFLVQKHIAASLGAFLLEAPARDEQWIDVGTGGGFPGMVLKLCCPDLHIVLLDSSRKKVIFLEWVRDKLAVRDLEIIEARVEALGLSEGPDIPKALEEGHGSRRFDVILLRAVAPLARALPLIDGIAGTNARLLTFKGAKWEEEVAAASDLLTLQGWSLESTLQIPWAPPKILRFVRSR